MVQLMPICAEWEEMSSLPNMGGYELLPNMGAAGVKVSRVANTIAERLSVSWITCSWIACTCGNELTEKFSKPKISSTPTQKAALAGREINALTISTVQSKAAQRGNQWQSVAISDNQW
mgnify:CR=1 FL=1|jgi:hypothetical protein